METSRWKSREEVLAKMTPAVRLLPGTYQVGFRCGTVLMGQTKMPWAAAEMAQSVCKTCGAPVVAVHMGGKPLPSQEKEECPEVATKNSPDCLTD